MSLETPLLTAHLFISRKNGWNGLKEMLFQLAENGITVRVYGPEDPLPEISPKQPRIYLSLGDEWEEFKTLCNLPYHERKRWLHYDSPEAILPGDLFKCWLNRTDPLPENKIIPHSKFSSDTPLVSIFTASYRSKEKIQRPYESLLKQTYTNWEWVIIDDSGDEDLTYHDSLLPLEDPRVRRYRQDCRNGYIGATKRYAAGLCTGEILVEVDHDDELTADCLEKIVRAFQMHPECGFAYGDCAEVYVGSNRAHWYGWDCGFGYSMYYRVWIHEMNRWQNGYKQTIFNGNTIRHLVGLPNHPRAWTRECYHLLGGHREELLVGDDYDMLVRTFLCTRFVAIPDLLYIQYRNENGDNSTFLRNSQIQTLCRELESFYKHRINERLKELDVPEYLPYKRVWETSPDDPSRKTAHVINEDHTKISYLFPIPYSFQEGHFAELFEFLEKGLDTDFRDIEIVVVGRVPEEVETYAKLAPMGAIRWWGMELNDPLETCIEYAKFCASCFEKVVILPKYQETKG